MKKILIIVIIVLSVGLIGTGLFFTFTGTKDGKPSIIIGSSGNDEIIYIDEEIANEEDIHTENVSVFRTVEDAIEYLKGIYETQEVKATYNDGIVAKIKVFPGTNDEIVYNYQIKGGDLIIDF